jgi:BirA family biotin operon repressor/biotin-[acetyl-CoA-carboxylase] ligase
MTSMRSNLIISKEAESTQDLVKELARAGEPEGVAIMAINQTKGRGSFQRSWISPPGKNLALSLLLRPSFPLSEVILLGLAASIAVAQTIEAFGVDQVRLKWPNDVLVRNRKMAGILSEAFMGTHGLDYVIIGVGINVNTMESDFPPDLLDKVTSLLICTGRNWSIRDTAVAFLKNIEVLYERANNEGCGFITEQWQERWAHRGVMMNRNGFDGIAEGIAPDGALLLRTESGRLERIISGRVEPMEV